LILIKLLQPLLIEILPLNTWQLFGTGASFNVGLPCHSLFIYLSEDLSNFKLFFNGNIKEAEGVSEQISLYLSIYLSVTIEGGCMINLKQVRDRLVVPLLYSGINDNIET
jgi:hypothetical protein